MPIPINLIVAFIDVRWVDVVDITLVAVLLYQLYNLIKGTAAINIFIGTLLFYFLWIVVKALKMQLFSSILDKFIDVGVIALIVVFQQELRRFLLFIGTTEFFGKSKFGRGLFDFRWQMKKPRVLNIKSIVNACKNMCENKTGAIIILPKNSNLKFYINTGETIDAKVSSKMIENIFFKNSPLHDGAIIISENRIQAARCVLPITENENFPAHLGMRHRAAVGITENSDAVAIVVSEQTGEISFVKDGFIKNSIPPEKLKDFLEKEFN